MMQASSESFHLHHHEQTALNQFEPMPQVHDKSNPDVNPAVATSNVGGRVVYDLDAEEETDDPSTTTMDYPLSMNSFYSHRDALSASGSYGADMSFVTTTHTSSVASPPPPHIHAPSPPEIQEPTSLPRLQLHEVCDGASRPSEYHRHLASSTHSAIKAAMERGTNMAYDESASVIGHSSAMAHTIASSSNMTKDQHHRYLFHSAFLQSHNNNDQYIEANAIVVEEDRQHPVVDDLPHPPSLPYKGTDLTTDSMFLGMEYDNDYIQTTKMKMVDSTTNGTTHPSSTKSSLASSEETMRRIQRKRILCCVYMLVALILIIGVGGILCTFGTTCPGIEKLSSRSSSSSASSEDKFDGSLAPTPSTALRNSPTPNLNTVPTSSPTVRPIVSKTDPPTKRPIAIVVPPPMVVVDTDKESKSPTLSPMAAPRENEEPSPTNDGSVDNGKSPSAAPSDENDSGSAPENINNDNEPEKEPTASPTKEPNNDVPEENGNDTPTATPTVAPTISPPNDDVEPTSSNRNDDQSSNDDMIEPTVAPMDFNDDGNDDNTDDDRP